METHPAETRSGGALLAQKVQVTFRIHGRDPITVEGEEGESVLDVALAHEISLEHNCGGNCACTTCHVIVKEGMEHLSEMQEDEEDRLDKAKGLTLHSRLGCQAKLHGDVVVEIPA